MKAKKNIEQKIIINKHLTIIEAIEKMDNLKKKLLIIVEDDKFFGLLSIGDIQRAIINKVSLKNSIENILRKEITICSENDSFDFVKNKMMELRTECMPIIDNDNKLINVVFWEDVFGVEQKRKEVSLKIPVVIMAGGKGTRLKPLTNVLPKPLLPINEKTIIEDIMDKFVEVGCKDFYLSVNYKAKQ